MTTRNSTRLLDETRRVIDEARGVLGGGADARDGGPEGILELYEMLCRSLDEIEADRLRALLARIAEHIEELNGLAGEIESVRRLHRGLREG